LVDFITSPAPNRGAIENNQPHFIAQIDKVFRERIELVLRLALREGCDALVLGAWGCGVFRNKPQKVAEIFGDILLKAGEFNNAFEYVSFSIPEHQKRPINSLAFKNIFG
jgi:uncharacterized protein (TIGR02452 family)